MMDRFNKTEKRLQQDSDRREEQYQTQLTEKNAAIESFRILHTPSTVPDPEQYTSAMHKAKMDSKYNDFVALESMSQEQIDEQFSRPESLLEKAEKAMNVEGISPEQIQNIYDIANQHSDTKLVIQEDDVTGYRVFVSPKTGSVTSAGVNPEKAGEKLTEGDKTFEGADFGSQFNNEDQAKFWEQAGYLASAAKYKYINAVELQTAGGYEVEGLKTDIDFLQAGVDYLIKEGRVTPSGSFTPFRNFDYNAYSNTEIGEIVDKDLGFFNNSVFDDVTPDIRETLSTENTVISNTSLSDQTMIESFIKNNNPINKVNT